MATTHAASVKLLIGAIAVTLAATSSGCVGIPAQILYMIRGVKVEAESDDLKDRRVAVVCVSDASLAGVDHTSQTLARYLRETLNKNVKGIELVRQDEVLDWIDNNNWDQIDFTQIGRGVEADMVLAVEVSSYSLNNGSTLYQGHANVTVSVYDMGEGDKLIFRRTIPSFVFPQNGGRPVTDTTRAQFEQQFLYMLSQRIGNYFYDYEMAEDFGRDAALLNR